MNEDLTSFLPLSPAALHIMLSLAGEVRHGYGIMQEVARQSNGHYKLGPGTLYDNLQKLMNQGIVEEIHRSPGLEDQRRRYFRLTTLGRRVLATDIERLKRVVREGSLRLRGVRPIRA